MSQSKISVQGIVAAIQSSDSIDFNALEGYFTNSTVQTGDALTGESIFGFNDFTIFELCRLPEGEDDD